MRGKRISKAVAVGAALALALTACAPGGGDAPSESAKTSQSSSGTNSVEPANSGLADLGDIKTQDAEIKVSVGAPEFIGYNSNTPQTYSTYNSAITDRVLSGFSYFGTDGAIYPNDDLVAYEKVSDDPLTIKYTIKPEAKWSDGTPITVADAVLAWATQNANLKNSKGKQLFDSVSADLGDTVPKGPEGAADGKEFTVTFKEPDPDWQIQSWMGLPAHVVAKQGGMSTTELVDAIRANDAKKVTKAAEFWNTGWTTKPGALPDADLIPSSGPYKLKSWSAGQSVTLEANENYYGTPAATKTLTFRFIDDGAMVQALQNKEVDRIILTRPAVEAGERLGFLPGDLMAKVDPYLRPLYDALNDMVDAETAARLLERGTIEVAPLAFMRGRTLNSAFIILDEAQNTSPEQMKMFLTRIGFGSKAVITGDTTQVDVAGGRSGLGGLERILDGIDGLGFVKLTGRDVVRHRIVAAIVDAYEREAATPT